MSIEQKVQARELGEMISRAIKESQHAKLVEKIKMERVSEKNQCTKIVDKNQADQIDWDYFIERKNYQDWWNGYVRFHS